MRTITGKQIQDKREALGISMHEAKKQLQNGSMMDAILAATTVEDLKPILLTLISRQGEAIW